MKRVVVVGLLLLPGIAFAEDRPYLHARISRGPLGGSTTLESTTSVGMRSVRPFGEDGIEQRLGATVGLTDWLSFRASEGLAWTRNGDFLGHSPIAEVQARLLNERDHRIDLSLGAGYQFAYDRVSIPSGHIVVSRNFGRFNITGNGVVEVPLAQGRDSVDLLVALAASYALATNLRLGIETAAEDLEGFWEGGEAEGGARLLVGPTVRIAVTRKFQVVPGIAWVYHMTRSVPINSTRNLQPAPQSGLVARLGLMYTFGLPLE